MTMIESSRFDLLKEFQDAAVAFDANYRVVFWNRAAEDLFHIKVSEALGLSVEQLIEMTGADIAGKEFREQVQKTGSWRGQATHKPNRGQTVRIDWSISRCELDDGDGGYLAIVREITDFRLTEKGRSSDQQMFSDLLHFSPVGMSLSTLKDGRYFDINAEALRIYGASRNEMIGKTALDLGVWIVPESRAQIVSLLESQGFVRNIEIEVRTNSGKFIPLIFSATKFEIEGEMCMLASAQDITERKKAEEALRDSEKRYRSFVRNFRGIAYRAKMDFIPIFFHGAVEEITGYTEEDLCSGKPRWDQVIHPEDISALFTEDEKKLHSVCNHSYEREYRIIHKNGKVVWVSDLIQNICDDSGNPANLQGVIYDITKRKMSEFEQRKIDEKIRDAQKLESLGVLAGGIAHDFNNLLMGVLGNAEMALLDLNPESPTRSYIKDIQTASIRLAELTKQMLAYSGKGRFVIETLNLSRLVEEMAHLLKSSIPKKVEFRLQLDHNLPAIRADASQIRQVVMNLITNAAEAFGDESGIVSLTSGVLHADRSTLSNYLLSEDLPDENYVFLEVSDTGCGMDNVTLRKIFDPFFSTKFTGRGLGLSAVQGIISNHCGAIKIYSENNLGTTVKILLPIEEVGCEEFSEDSPDESQSFQGQGMVLLVDDEEEVLKIGRLMLERMGYTVISAADGMEAVQQVLEHANELVCVLLDLTMPKMDGLEAFSELRRIHSDLPVILCSGYDQQKANSRLIDKDLTVFLQKPYRYQNLVEKLREVLKR